MRPARLADLDLSIFISRHLRKSCICLHTYFTHPKMYWKLYAILTCPEISESLLFEKRDCHSSDKYPQSLRSKDQRDYFKSTLEICETYNYVCTNLNISRLLLFDESRVYGTLKDLENQFIPSSYLFISFHYR